MEEPRHVRQENLELFGKEAKQVLKDAGLPAKTSDASGLEGNTALAAEIQHHIAAIEQARRSGRIDDAIRDGAILEAIQLGQRFAELRSNLHFEAAYREKERRIARASALTDEQIIAELKRAPTFAAAAAKLGITEQQIRNRIPRSERSRIRKNRKS